MGDYQWPPCVNAGGGSRPLLLDMESRTEACLNRLKRNHIKLLLLRISSSLDKILDSLTAQQIETLYQEIGDVPDHGQDFMEFLESIISFNSESNRLTLVLEKLQALCAEGPLAEHFESLKSDWGAVMQIYTEPKFESYLPIAKLDRDMMRPFISKLERQNRLSDDDMSEFRKALSALKPIRLQNFVKVHQVGQGAYGDVWLAEDIVNKVPVALKKLKLNEEREGFPKNAIREILLLNSLKHKNIVNLLGISYSKSYASESRGSDPGSTGAPVSKEERNPDNPENERRNSLGRVQGEQANDPYQSEDAVARNKNSAKDKKNDPKPIDRSKENVWMVFEYLPFDLSGYLEALRDKSDKFDFNNKMQEQQENFKMNSKYKPPPKAKNKWEKMLKPNMWLSIGEIKGIMFQLLRAVAFCHKNNVLHRDLKTANLLMSNDGLVKLADFGLARFLPLGKGVLTNRVVTLWYRPPELLLGSERYDFAVDLWSVGCILAELVSGAHVFAADREGTILKLICENIGLPDETDLKYLKTLPNFYDRMLNPLHPDKIASLVTKEKEFENIFMNKNQLGKDGWDLLKKLFSWSPARRISAKDALKHDWFQKEPMLVLLRERRGIRDAHSFMAKNQKKRESIKSHQKSREYVKYANTGEIRRFYQNLM